MVTALPKKLKQDAIVEAILEIQFDSNEQSEIIIGRLSDTELWSGYSTARLGPANLPESIREVDESLRYQAVLNKLSQDKSEAVRIGSHVISYHMYAPYQGWETFQAKLTSVVSHLFEKVPSATVKRLGFRYVNFLTSNKHEINDFGELSLIVNLSGTPVTEGINLTLGKSLSDSHHSISKVVSSNFLALAVIPESLVCAIDIDIFTPANYSTTSIDEVTDWVEKAHIFEKQSFFSFLSKDTIDKLTEE